MKSLAVGHTFVICLFLAAGHAFVICLFLAVGHAFVICLFLAVGHAFVICLFLAVGHTFVICLFLAVGHAFVICLFLAVGHTFVCFCTCFFCTFCVLFEEARLYEGTDWLPSSVSQRVARGHLPRVHEDIGYTSHTSILFFSF